MFFLCPSGFEEKLVFDLLTPLAAGDRLPDLVKLFLCGILVAQYLRKRNLATDMYMHHIFLDGLVAT